MCALTWNERLWALEVYRTERVHILSIISMFVSIFNVFTCYKILKKTAVNQTGFFSTLQLHQFFLYPSTFLRILVRTQTSPVKGEGVGGLGGSEYHRR